MKDNEIYVNYGDDFYVTYAVQTGDTSAYIRDIHSLHPGGTAAPQSEICLGGTNYEVVRVGARACGDNWTEEVVLPPFIKEIDEEAFRFSSGLKRVTLPEGLRRIDNGAFEICRELESITIPSSVEEIGPYCFTQDRQMKEIVFSDPSNSHLKKIGCYAFIGCDMLEYVELPDGIEYIESFAFAYCKNLRHVVLPMKAHVDENAFGRGVEIEYSDIIKDRKERSLRTFTLGSAE